VRSQNSEEVALVGYTQEMLRLLLRQLPASPNLRLRELSSSSVSIWLPRQKLEDG
jgi:hypothetical protein